MRSRPEISLRLPPVVHAGETLHVDITLESASETPIDFVDAVLGFFEEIRPLENGETVPPRKLLHRAERLESEGTLGVGTHRYRASFDLPEDLPPTHVGSMIELRCVVEVYVSIPWWPDARETQEVKARPALRPRPEDRPVSSSSQQGSEPFVEVSLPRRCFAPGEVIEGAAAFGNLGDRRPVALEVALVGMEQASGTRWEGHRYSVFQALDRVRAGEEVSFRLRVPDALTPGFRGEAVALDYALVATLDHEEGRVAHRAPVQIGMYGPRGGAREKRPRVGAGRWRSVWARAGRRAGLEIDEEALVLAGLLADCTVEVQPGRGQGDEPGIIASVRFPVAWGLDLDLRNRTLIEQGLALGKDGFALRYRARGREEAQVQAALGSGMQEALLAFDEARVNDDKAWVFCGGGAQDEERLRSFLDRVETLAEAVACATEALPPPSAMAEHLPAWRRFALEVGGALEVGRMRLTGSVEGAAFALATRFAGEAPASTRIAITAEPPIEESAAGDAEALALRPEARGLAAAIREQAARLGEVRRGPDATPEGVALEVGAPLADPAAARGALGAMLALASALRKDRRGGPYR